MIPSPPIWMSTSSTTWPNTVQCVAVSTDESPVTQTADADPSTVAESGIERPPRTPLSSPDVRLARAADLLTVLSPESVPLKP